MRDLPTIEAELKAASYEAAKLNGIVSALNAEHLEALRCRILSVVADFDAGLTFRQIINKHGIKDATVGTILWRNKRFYRVKAIPITSLPAEQQRHYHKCLRNGMGKGAARQAAMAI